MPSVVGAYRACASDDIGPSSPVWACGAACLVTCSRVFCNQLAKSSTAMQRSTVLYPSRFKFRQYLVPVSTSKEQQQPNNQPTNNQTKKTPPNGANLKSLPYRRQKRTTDYKISPLTVGYRTDRASTTTLTIITSLTLYTGRKATRLLSGKKSLACNANTRLRLVGGMYSDTKRQMMLCIRNPRHCCNAVRCGMLDDEERRCSGNRPFQVLHRLALL